MSFAPLVPEEAEAMGAAMTNRILAWTRQMDVVTQIKNDLLSAQQANHVPAELLASAMAKVTEVLGAATNTTVLNLEAAKELRDLVREMEGVFRGTIGAETLRNLGKIIQTMQKSQLPVSAAGDVGGAAAAEMHTTPQAENRPLANPSSSHSISPPPINNNNNYNNEPTQRLSSETVIMPPTKDLPADIKAKLSELDAISTRINKKLTINSTLFSELKDLVRKIHPPLTPESVIEAAALAEKQFLDEQAKIDNHCTMLHVTLEEKRALKEENEVLKEKIRVLEEQKRNAIKKAATRGRKEADAKLAAEAKAKAEAEAQNEKASSASSVKKSIGAAKRGTTKN